MHYDDGLIACGSGALITRRYDIFLRSKRIPYCGIRSVRQIPSGSLRRWRLWGMSDHAAGSTWT